MPGGSAPSARTRWALRRSEPAPARVCRRRLHFDSGVDSAWYRRRHRMIRAGRRRSMRVTASPKSITTCGIARLQPAAKPLGAHFRGAMRPGLGRDISVRKIPGHSLAEIRQRRGQQSKPVEQQRGQETVGTLPRQATDQCEKEDPRQDIQTPRPGMPDIGKTCPGDV
jgi:hypothetical protein